MDTKRRLEDEYGAAKRARGEAEDKMRALTKEYTEWYYREWWKVAEPIWRDLDKLGDALNEVDRKRTDHTRKKQKDVVEKIRAELLERASKIDDFFKVDRERLVKYIEWYGKEWWFLEPRPTIAHKGADRWYSAPPVAPECSENVPTGTGSGGSVNVPRGTGGDGGASG